MANQIRKKTAKPLTSRIWRKAAVARRPFKSSSNKLTSSYFHPQRIWYKKVDQSLASLLRRGTSTALNSQAFSGIANTRFAATTSLDVFNRPLKCSNRIIYFEPTSELYFDQNGKKPGFGEAKESGLFAILKGSPDLTSQDLSLI